MIRRLVVLCAACVFPSAAPAAEQGQVPWRPDGVRAVLRAAPTRVTVGDPIPCAITITVPAGVQAVPPTPRELPGGIRVKFLGLDRTGGKNPPPGEFSYRYDLRIYETGEKRIPSVPVLLQGVAGRSATLDLGGLFFMVESVLDKDAKNIRDIKPPINISYIPKRLIVAGILICAVVVLLGWVIGRRKRAAMAPPPPPVPPHLRAYEELRRLQEKGLIAAGRVKEYYIALSDIVRRYIEGRFGLKAPDRTTEEFLAEAADSLDARARTLVGDFLEQCDMVKFARYGPTGAEINGAWQAARRFVDETSTAAQSQKP